MEGEYLSLVALTPAQTTLDTLTLRRKFSQFRLKESSDIVNVLSGILVKQSE